MRNLNGADDDWRQLAACTSNHPELFFPIGSGVPAQAQVEQARRVCRSCQVQNACLDWALKTGVEGVWGGLSEDERRTLLRKRRGASHPG
jgi:WhiB family redox-sensing transcriptional regulator